MSRAPRVDPAPHLARVAQALAQPGQPAPLWAALDAALGAVIGHKLFTVLRFHADSRESERCYTNQPGAYPVGGRKPFTESPWSRQLFGERRPYIGTTAEHIRSVFFDHALIISLGCESVLNVPVAFDGRVLGTLNLLHEAGWYGEEDAAPGLVFAALAAPGYLSLR
ncbi:MAG TPA: GAF domain-containing protein [Methylomirabilota bacterium]|nr:GAF domain-containing protein [Methylomirabilota bacterium]